LRVEGLGFGFRVKDFSSGLGFVVWVSAIWVLGLGFGIWAMGDSGGLGNSV